MNSNNEKVKSVMCFLSLNLTLLSLLINVTNESL